MWMEISFCTQLCLLRVLDIQGFVHAIYIYLLYIKCSETVLHCGWKPTIVDCDLEFLASAFSAKLSGSVINQCS